MIACEWEEPSDKQNGKIIISNTATHLTTSVVMWHLENSILVTDT